MQLANVLGKSQWLTCPRKVSSPIRYFILGYMGEQIRVVRNVTKITTLAGSVNWLASL